MLVKRFGERLERAWDHMAGRCEQLIRLFDSYCSVFKLQTSNFAKINKKKVRCEVVKLWRTVCWRFYIFTKQKTVSVSPLKEFF
jgi:hypothetical protein